jgi:hypothetical protein
VKSPWWHSGIFILPFFIVLPANPQEIAVGVITQVRGEVKLYAPGAKTARGADVADLLHNGTRIVTGKDGQVSFLFCPESIAAEAGSSTELRFSTTQVQAKVGSLRNRRPIPSCQVPVAAVSETSAEHLGGMLLRGQSSLTLLSPVGTNVVDSHVRFRWKQLDQATQYRIDLKDEKGNEIWKATSQASSIDYAGKQAFERGKVYRWRVMALEDLEVLSSASGFFRVLSEEEVARVTQLRRECLAWAQVRPADPTSHLLLAFLYEEMQLPDLALEEYRRVAENGDQSKWLEAKVRTLQQLLNPSM